MARSAKKISINKWDIQDSHLFSASYFSSMIAHFIYLSNRNVDWNEMKWKTVIFSQKTFHTRNFLMAWFSRVFLHSFSLSHTPRVRVCLFSGHEFSEYLNNVLDVKQMRKLYRRKQPKNLFHILCVNSKYTQTNQFDADAIYIYLIMTKWNLTLSLLRDTCLLKWTKIHTHSKRKRMNNETNEIQSQTEKRKKSPEQVDCLHRM